MTHNHAQVVNAGGDPVSPKVSPPDGFSSQNTAIIFNIGDQVGEGKKRVKPNKTACLQGKEWRAQQGSNLRPLAPEASALSN